MLEPTSRELFLSALAPPGGLALDQAVGTTYSLDLQALLAVPLALTFANCEGADGEPIRDAIALLEPIRRLTNRFAIYTRAGGIQLPPIDQRLFTFVEDSVVEVKAPVINAAFHPKVWVLRFTDAEQGVLYRVLVMTRNLTFDRCWDAMVVLEGIPGKRARDDPDPGPLADFIAALPGLAVRPIPQHHRDVAAMMAEELRSVSFAVPDGVESIAFHSLGLGGPMIDFAQRMDRLLVMSPFVTNGFLQRVLRPDTDDVLITRPDQAVALEASTVAGVQLFGINERADPEPIEDDAADRPGTPPLSGLHAKLIIADAGWKATLWLGSANATTAGHSANVEFVVEMAGPKSKLGIGAFLGDESNRGFRSLLTELDPEACLGEAPASQAGERQLSLWQTELAAMSLRIEVQETGPDEYALRLVVPAFSLLLAESGCTSRCWPSSLPGARGVALPLLEVEQTIDLPSVSLAALTAFLDVELTPPPRLGVGRSLFAVRVDLLGAPLDRPQRLLRNILKSKAEVRQYLLLLLAGSEVPVASLVGGESSGEGIWALGGFAAPGLFERLLTILTRDPQDLQRVARLVEDLQTEDDGNDRLPDGFLSVWEAVWAVASAEGKP
jgi:hypothetical protein